MESTALLETIIWMMVGIIALAILGAAGFQLWWGNIFTRDTHDEDIFH